VFGSVETLPVDLRLGVSLIYSSRVRLSPPVAKIEDDGSLHIFTEVAAMPFAWRLAIGDESGTELPADTVDVSDWTLIDPREVSGRIVTLPVGAITTGFPGDSRDPASVRAETARNLEG
jgi:hypothetical protein